MCLVLGMCLLVPRKGLLFGFCEEVILLYLVLGMCLLVSRKELSDLWATHTQATDHTSQQADLIRQLQTLHKDTRQSTRLSDTIVSVASVGQLHSGQMPTGSGHLPSGQTKKWTLAQ